MGDRASFFAQPVIPAQAGIQRSTDHNWIPACAGMTAERPRRSSDRDLSCHSRAGSIARRRRRAGMTLMEVLVSTFVISIGLLSLAALIPLGGMAILKTTQADMSGACGRAGLREVKVRRMLDYQFWPGVDPSATNLAPFAVDPLGIAKGLTGNLGGASGTMTRIGLTNVANADWIFTWRDDLSMYTPEDDTMRPQGWFIQGDGSVSGAPSGSSAFEGSYCWFFTVVPSPAEASLPIAQKKRYTVSVVVCSKRDFAATGEHTAQASFVGGVGFGGGTVNLTPTADLVLKEDRWIMLLGTSGQCKWYQVVSVGDEVPTTMVTLNGPDWDTARDANPQAVVVDGVLGVYTATIDVDQSNLLWNP